MFEVNSPEKIQSREKKWSQQVEHMQVPNGTGPGVTYTFAADASDFFCNKLFSIILPNWYGVELQFSVKDVRIMFVM